MRIAFDSSHLDGDFSSGLLTVGIRIEDDAAGLSTWDEIEFSVPPDFHAHNDAVAAALMTLAGRKYAGVTFNFPISGACAERLRAYYGDIAIGPVNPAAPARQPGKRLAINFSGGTDSVANWLLMHELYGDDFAVITTEYGGDFAFERRGYNSYPRDVSCHTNLRRKGYSAEGRFHFCVPLLYADYLDLGGIVTGHTLAQSPDGVADHRDGTRPEFLHGDLVVNAGALEDIHLLRSLTSTGVARLIMTLGPKRIDRALYASSPPGRSKQYLNAAIFKHLFADAGLPLTPYLRNAPPLRAPMRQFRHALRLLYLFKRQGAESVCRICPDFARLDTALLGELSFRFMDRYNPCVMDLLAEPLRSRVIELFASCGVVAYDEHDWDELAIVRRQLKAHFPRYAGLAD